MSETLNPQASGSPDPSLWEVPRAKTLGPCVVSFFVSDLAISNPLPF